MTTKDILCVRKFTYIRNKLQSLLGWTARVTDKDLKRCVCFAIGSLVPFFYLKNPQLTSVHEQIRLIETRLDIFVPAVIALKNTKKRFTDIIPLWIDLIQLTARIKLDRFRIILESIHTKCSFIYQDIQRIDDLLRDIRFYSIHLYRKSMIARKVNTIPIPIRSKLSLIHPRIASLLRDTENAKGRL